MTAFTRKVVEHQCPDCRLPSPDKGRAFDGRRAYRCTGCDRIWSEGLQGRARRYSPQRESFQFKVPLSDR